MRLPTDHPQRYALNNEIHARAPQDVEAPSQISYLVLTYSAAEKNQAHGDLARLCEMAGAATPPPDVLHFRSSFGQINLNWERHTEFATFTFTRHTSFAHPFKASRVRNFWMIKAPNARSHFERRFRSHCRSRTGTAYRENAELWCLRDRHDNRLDNTLTSQPKNRLAG